MGDCSRGRKTGGTGVGLKWGRRGKRIEGSGKRGRGKGRRGGAQDGGKGELVVLGRALHGRAEILQGKKDLENI